MSVICLNKLTKRYGKTLALDGLDLTIGEGEVHGFVGPNGAGKTTAMRILATLLRPTSGDALVDGISVTASPREARARVGYMPDFFGVYDNLKAWEYLDFYAGCTGMAAKARRTRIDELLELTALAQKREAYVDNLSRGMKQRLCLARALMHDPKLLILDEPASGMDPRARAEMRDILKNVSDMGKTVLISSHILPELAQMCDHMTILERGHSVFSGTVEALERKMNANATLVIRLFETVEAERIEQMKAKIQALYGVQPEAAQENTWRLEAPEDAALDAQALGALIAQGLPVCDFHREHATLERVFMEVTHDDQSDL